MAKVGSSSNDGRAQILIAHQREKGIIDDGASFCRALALGAMASGAESCVSAGAFTGVAPFFYSIRGRTCAKHVVRLCPTCAHLMHEDIDLLVRQSSAGTFCKCRH